MPIMFLGLTLMVAKEIVLAGAKLLPKAGEPAPQSLLSADLRGIFQAIRAFQTHLVAILM